jgi:hypothetical protein
MSDPDDSDDAAKSKPSIGEQARAVYEAAARMAAVLEDVPELTTEQRQRLESRIAAAYEALYQPVEVDDARFRVSVILETAARWTERGVTYEAIHPRACAMLEMIITRAKDAPPQCIGRPIPTEQVKACLSTWSKRGGRGGSKHGDLAKLWNLLGLGPISPAGARKWLEKNRDRIDAAVKHATAKGSLVAS